MLNKDKNITTLITHLKTMGFVFQGSEIYGGLANTWDYGPLGAMLKDNIEATWKRFFIQGEKNNFLLDSKILMNPQVWVTSGHVVNFNDPLIENLTNGKRYRADKLIEQIDSTIVAETLTFSQMKEFLDKNLTEYEGSKAKWSEIRKFNLMFETKQGVTEETKSKIYLRPETTQGIMVNFKNVQRAMRAKMPMGIGQVGKSFRNEVTPGNFIFRTREFEQMELEVFCAPEQANELFEYYVNRAQKFTQILGLSNENTRLRIHEKEELAHYSTATTDIEYRFPFGWGELLGVANRTNFDLSAHQKATGESLEYLDPNTNQKYIPHVIEPSMGLDRLMFAVLIEAYDEEKIDEDTRIVLRLDKKIAPYKVAVLPLVKKLSPKASEIYDDLLSRGIDAIFDETASIGKRYRRQDAIGTPTCITVDFDSLEDECVTVRDRDTMEQKRIKITDLIMHI
ncbi:glycyl-tRNA synthetase (Glycine-tRNA ligase) [Mycoplasmopsis californica HAZ160_1]|uniref:glycine--tRNA ligase n=1 Tax=Mycoplasmopsis californica HAZ160_1 TaxID=1397850 RepID=A0AAT9F8C3_9BACT|nr:glycine--tRNA ligase [Mycoplasmopsis californica]BAP01130.1 glycyl-tRNA synthetase (Glycine-tRNA ligase) [Mycoplasmopsis californica HAZ160_1]BBG40996.1 glycyl-tRNA synthetase [Mycoplasmopsis californica]BBG41589.1 glycyl-tRNA synthetase [Mycoplasmopsis californica]BBG42183.1 glycyl-tRNA synthetase [Mycoplasmopsis californica]BBG42765.1 glycyl-tRNA synthetase [Mycoplasmopsis californica]